MQILIVTGGKIDIDFALDFLRGKKFDEIIAVDGALAFFEQVGEKLGNCGKPTHIVGDFDTISTEILEKYRADSNICCHSFNPEKDYTDTDIAVRLALKLMKGGGYITMLGATGGTRADHMLANLQLLMLPLRARIGCEIVDQYNRIRMIEGSIDIKAPYGKYVSLIPVTEVLEGVDIVGFKYPLKNKTVYLGESLCVSNELTAAQGTISIRKGTALLIEAKD